MTDPQTPTDLAQALETDAKERDGEWNHVGVRPQLWRDAAALLRTQVATIARLEAERDALLANGTRHVAIVAEALQRAEAAEALNERDRALRANQGGRDKLYESFGHRIDEQKTCKCAYCTQDGAVLAEYAANLEMDIFTWRERTDVAEKRAAQAESRAASLADGVAGFRKWLEGQNALAWHGKLVEEAKVVVWQVLHDVLAELDRISPVAEKRVESRHA